jgi:hypothetical protein
LAADLFRKTFWTLAAWTSHDALDSFARTTPHTTTMASIRPYARPATFVFWTCRGSDLPLTWAEARRRVAAELGT